MLASNVRSRSEVEHLLQPRLQRRELELAARVARAGGVLLLWVLAAVPLALGWQRCTFATLLHRPCPGCGMTRAVRLLQAGDVGASLRMHPLALPVVAAGALIALSTIWATLGAGTPLYFYRQRLGRSALVFAIAVYASALVLWIARWFGFLGGPVPVG
jgi:hypothetical protein